MSTLGWITMGIVLTVVWGGFACSLLTAVRREKRKQARDTPR